jgi:hypothetical protein
MRRSASLSVCGERTPGFFRSARSSGLSTDPAQPLLGLSLTHPPGPGCVTATPRSDGRKCLTRRVH